METKYAEELRQIMGLIATQEPKAKILVKARDLKADITKAWSELQQAVSLLDSLITQYAPDKDWPLGFWRPPPVIHAVQPPVWRVPVQTSFGTSRPTGLITRPERVLEVSSGVAKAGVVETKDIVDRLRADGDQRPVRSLAVSIGNVLTRHGWQRIEPGKYKLREKQPAAEVK